MNFLINQTFNGLSYAALLFLIGGGMTLILGVMRIVNIAHGSFYLVGGYIAVVVVSKTGNFYLALLISSVLIALLEHLYGTVFLRERAGKDLRQMLITSGIAFFLADLSMVIWGGNPMNLDLPEYLTGAIEIGDYYFPTIRIFMVGSAAVLFVILWLFLEKTKLGAVIRAAVDNPEMAEGMGINVTLVEMIVFGMGAFLAAFGGVVGCAFMGIYPGLDMELLPFAFVVVIVGGMGSLTGAAVGAVIVALIDNFGKALFPDFAYFTLFAPMGIMLAVRPRGLFGKVS